MSRPRKNHVLNKIATLCVCALLAACTQPSKLTEPSSGSGTVTISIVATNDVHGSMLSEGGYGGLAIFGGFVENIRQARKEDGGAVLLLDAGDMWQGTLESNLTEGASMVRAYNVLGYDAAAIGNHEFDFGPIGPRSTPRAGDDPTGALKARATEASFPLVSSNLIEKKSGRPVNWPNVSPSVTVEVAGTKVGIIGGITAEALLTTFPSNVRELDVVPLATAFQAEAEKLRRAGARVVIVTTHAGGRCTDFADPNDLQSCDNESEIFDVARSLPAGLIDVIIAGHSHSGIAHVVNGIAISSSYSNLRAFGRIDLQVAANGEIVDTKLFAPRAICEFEFSTAEACKNPAPNMQRAIYEGAEVVRDATVESVLKTALAKVIRIKDRELGIVVESAMERGSRPDSAIGNLLTDIMLQMTPAADIAIHNTLGGIRANLPAGPLTYGRVYEVFPFDNRVVQLQLTGRELRTIYEGQFSSRQWRNNIAGAQVHASCDNGQLNVELFDGSGIQIPDDAMLTVATTDFLALGGDGIFSPVMPADGFDFDLDAPLFRDRIIAWVESSRGRTTTPTALTDDFSSTLSCLQIAVRRRPIKRQRGFCTSAPEGGSYDAT